MFTFYDLNDLLLLNNVQLLPRLGVPILIPRGKLKRHEFATVKRIEGIADKGYVKIFELDDEGFAFVIENRRSYRSESHSFLEMLYMCKSTNSAIVAEEDEHTVRAAAHDFGLNVYTMDEFNTATINNKEYFDFINEIKLERRRKMDL
jgi:hypothetical protein